MTNLLRTICTKSYHNQSGFVDCISKNILVCFFGSRCSYHYTVSPKNDTDVAHYNFDTGQPILVIFGRDVAETVYYQMVICYSTSPN